MVLCKRTSALNNGAISPAPVQRIFKETKVMRRQRIIHVKLRLVVPSFRMENEKSGRGTQGPLKYLECLFTTLTWLLDTLQVEFLIVYTVEICFVYTFI